MRKEFLKCLAEEICFPVSHTFPSAFVAGWGFGSRQTETVTLPFVWKEGWSLGATSLLFVSEQILLDPVLDAVKIHCSFGTIWLYNRNFSGAFLTYIMSAGIKLDGSCVLLLSESNLISWKTSVKGFSNCSILLLF